MIMENENTNNGISTYATIGEGYLVPVQFVTSDGATIDNANITTETTCSDLTVDIISVRYDGFWHVYEGEALSSIENNLTVTFSLDGYKPIVWSGKSVSVISNTPYTTLTFEKIPTLSDQITRLQTAKEDIKTALNTLVPKMVDPELSIDKYGELITNVISNSKLNVKQVTQISTNDGAIKFCNAAKARKQPMVVWFSSTATIAEGCKKLTALNWTDCCGAAFAYLSPSYNDTQFGPVDLSVYASALPVLIFIDPDFDMDAPISGIDFYCMVGVVPNNITLSVIQQGLRTLPFYLLRD